MIQGIIGKPEVIRQIVAPLNPIQATIEELSQGFNLLFLCEKVVEAIYAQSNITDSDDDIEPFYYFDSKMKQYLELIASSGVFAYIETDYFGGAGTQSAGLFKEGKLLEAHNRSTWDIDTTVPWPERLQDEPINNVLRKIGVVKNFASDEFDTLGLGKYRDMPYNEI